VHHAVQPDDRTNVARLDALDTHRLATAGDSATCAIALANVPDWGHCRARLESGVRGVALDADVAVVSVVGDGLTASARALPRFLAVLAELGLAPRSVHAGPLRLAATIDSARLGDAQRALHAAFVTDR
jgi:hypothetical protein